MRMLPNRLVDQSKRLLLLVGLSTSAAILPPGARARAPPAAGAGAAGGCASGFATASPADAAAKHSYSPRPHLYNSPPEHLKLKVHMLCVCGIGSGG